MKPTIDQIKEIAELLEIGELCFFHKITGEIESYPDPDRNPFVEPEMWQEVIDKVDADYSNYLKFEQMDSREAFRIMENFAISLSDQIFKERLFDQLSRPKPFSNFKWAIDNSTYRQDWFDFKAKAYQDWVADQIF